MKENIRGFVLFSIVAVLFLYKLVFGGVTGPVHTNLPVLTGSGSITSNAKPAVPACNVNRQ